ncbi:MAG: purine-binding chemotaxis protein CheW [Pedosphaera sp.]|nr:purine-binding chemotaxis protein CheW [Pedosphaera sp.]
MNTTNLETPAVDLSHALAGKHLTFRLGNESYGIAVLKIREIIRLTAITAVPKMPTYIKGVINLRGKVIPVVDLRIKFGLPEAESNERTCIVVVQVELANHNKVLMGLIVDAVEEVVSMAAQDIEETPSFGASLDTAFILGMAKVKGAVKSLLDIDKVVAFETNALLQARATAD